MDYWEDYLRKLNQNPETKEIEIKKVANSILESNKFWEESEEF